ncbi:hypothetical protein FIBSPDRAFT_882851 [Athelia psychrophila]|uniref:Uncharacterized protein n=1 Tax=Athelia psychrophila TaxID=1759441 RepID=A0A166USK5_9AGAM|nr:hypothetical protein FIBSPDRAFT_882851 [Fibularhizoctonia sp. CBS 109695]
MTPRSFFLSKLALILLCTLYTIHKLQAFPIDAWTITDAAVYGASRIVKTVVVRLPSEETLAIGQKEERKMNSRKAAAKGRTPGGTVLVVVQRRIVDTRAGVADL